MWLLIACAIFLAAAEAAFAQCAMCKSVLAGSENPAEAARTFNTAILVLFLPTLAILGAIAWLVFRSRHIQGDGGGGAARKAELQDREAPRRSEETSGRRSTGMTGLPSPERKASAL
jgi:hypothetical protein